MCITFALVSLYVIVHIYNLAESQYVTNSFYLVAASMPTTSFYCRSFKTPGWEVHKEVHCISAADSNRRADNIAIDRFKDEAMVLDSTTRFERNHSQAGEVNKEYMNHAYLFILLNMTFLLISGPSKICYLEREVPPTSY